MPRVDDRRVLNGVFWVLRSGAPWRDLPGIYGPCTTCYNRCVRWRRAGVWDRIMEAPAAAHDAAVQMIDTSVVRVHKGREVRLHCRIICTSDEYAYAPDAVRSCAPAAKRNAATALPRSVMNSRRFIRSPHRRGREARAGW
jgi:transposase